LLYGSPGRSLALEIAGRLGLHPDVVAAARENLSAREAQLAEHLAKIDRDMRALEHDQRLVSKERDALRAAEARTQQREEALRLREETVKRRLAEELDAQVRRARKEIDEVIAELKAKTTAIANAPRLVWTGDTGAGRVDARAAVENVAKRILNAEEAPAEGAGQPMAGGQPASIAVGDRVIVGGLGIEAIVTATHDGTAELDVRGKRMR